MEPRFLLNLLTEVAMLLVSCDDGRIVDTQADVREEGRVVQMSGAFSGINRWADGYSVVLAGFADQGDYAVISKALPVDGTDGAALTLTLGGIGSEVDQLRLCVVNRLRESVYDFHTWRMDELSATDDTLRLSLPTMEVGMYAAIQQGVFARTCTACHGAGERPAAALNLLPAQSHTQLVGQPSVVCPDSLRVRPGSAGGSVLYLMLATDMSHSMGVDHSDMLPAGGVSLKLIKDWIDYGAEP